MTEQPTDITDSQTLHAGDCVAGAEAVSFLTHGYPLALLAWLSPSFPIGSFAFSHGLEYAAESGAVRDVETTRAWIAALLEHGGSRNDVILLGVAMRAASAGDMERLRSTNDLSLAMAGSSERLLETTAQGNAFITAISDAWSTPTFVQLSAELTGPVAYPIAVAISAVAHGFPRTTVLQSAALAIVQNLVSAAIRLGAIGQTGGQRIIHALLPDVMALSAFANTATIDDVGGAAFRSDIAAMKHETQYTRLFRS